MTYDNTIGGATSNYQLQSNVCPGCGRCNTCGRPYEQPAFLPSFRQPIYRQPTDWPPFYTIT